MGVACCSLIITVIPLRSTKREMLPTCSCFTTAAAAGTFTGWGGAVVVSFVGTLGRPRPLCGHAESGNIVVRTIICKARIESLNGCTAPLLFNHYKQS